MGRNCTRGGAGLGRHALALSADSGQGAALTPAPTFQPLRARRAIYASFVHALGH